jgi:hypothetical protein
MATVNLGRIKPVFRGAFNNSTAYVIDDIVTSGNETFIAIAATQGNATSDASKWTKLAAKGADGTDVGATLANKEIAFKTNAGAIDGIPIGTAGQFLKVNSGATGYEFGAVADAPVTRLLDVNITSTVSHIDLSLGSLDDYIMVKIVMEDMSVDTSGVDVYCGVMQGDPPAYSAIQHEYIANTGGSAISSGSTIGARINGGGLNASDSKWSGEFNWIALSSGMRPSGWGHATYLDGSNNRQGCQGFYQMTANENGVTGFRILGQSNNFRGQGKITVFGYKHS